MSISRRELFKKLGKGAAYVAVLATLPKLAFAKWNKAGFESHDYDKSFKLTHGDLPVVDAGSDVKFKAPAIAENGAVVPIKLSSTKKDVKRMSIFVKDNPNPLIASFDFGPKSVPDVQIRIRMGKTSEVITYVEAGGKLYKSSQQVKVTIGGCGG